MDTMISSLVEYGMAGIFLAFMVWTYISNTKRMDAQLDKFVDKIESLRKEHSEKEEIIRNRFDIVIAAYNKEKDEATTKFKEQMHEIMRDLKQMEQHFTTLSLQSESSMDSVREMGARLQEIATNLRDLSNRAESIYLHVEASAESLKHMQDQEKMKQAAKIALAESNTDGNQQ